MLPMTEAKKQAWFERHSCGRGRGYLEWCLRNALDPEHPDNQARWDYRPAPDEARP